MSQLIDVRTQPQIDECALFGLTHFTLALAFIESHAIEMSASAYPCTRFWVRSLGAIVRPGSQAPVDESQ
jgi:hypothetical protein